MEKFHDRLDHGCYKYPKNPFSIFQSEIKVFQIKKRYSMICFITIVINI